VVDAGDPRTFRGMALRKRGKLKRCEDKNDGEVLHGATILIQASRESSTMAGFALGGFRADFALGAK
jgi:hypothetical protein